MVRFIPTLVGNAPFSKYSTSNGSVYPHARGERAQPTPHGLVFVGLSPRSWGTHLVYTIDSQGVFSDIFFYQIFKDRRRFLWAGRRPSAGRPNPQVRGGFHQGSGIQIRIRY